MSGDANPTRFSEWLRGPIADQSGPIPRGFGPLKTLIADAMALPTTGRNAQPVTRWTRWPVEPGVTGVATCRSRPPWPR